MSSTMNLSITGAKIETRVRELKIRGFPDSVAVEIRRIYRIERR